MIINDTVLFAGAGLASAVGLPTTKELTDDFLSLGPTAATRQPLQDHISRHLRSYWQTVFGYVDLADSPKPSFEDHFTTLDLAANTGHALGIRYTPKQLRAIRRLSIHRVFDILNSRLKDNPPLRSFLRDLAVGNHNCVVTPNWDIAIERHLTEHFTYAVPVFGLDGKPHTQQGLPVLKLHGSSNWAYCDCCTRLYAYDDGKGALNEHLFIDKADFEVLADTAATVTFSPVEVSRQSRCYSCDMRLSSRVATFSYAKVLNFIHFLTIWERAFTAMRDAAHWIFVGYSLPEADFQLRHMLKTAQLGHADRPLSITVVTKDAQTNRRFAEFFGSAVSESWEQGLDVWLAESHAGAG